MEAKGYRSCYKEAVGSEPEATWFLSTGLEDFEGAESFPEGIYAKEESAYDETASELCIDYVWARGAEIKVKSAHLIGQKPLKTPVGAPVFASDHFGVVVDIELLAKE